MKTLLSVMFILFVSASVFAADNNKKENASGNEASVNFSGIITDQKTGELLAGVEVKIEGTDQKTYSDFDGKFTFRNLKPGNYNLVASYISYHKSNIKELKPGQAQEVNIKMHPAK